MGHTSGLSWEGSVVDGKVLRDALKRRNRLKVPHGKLSYDNGKGFLAPFGGQRYHLNEWRQGHEPSSLEEFFNRKHAVARNVIEMCFGLLKIREMSFDPIKVDLGEYIETNIAVDDDFISTMDPTDVWGNLRMELANQMFNEWQASRQNDD
ncbi:Uncharacterized protein TCM_039339 [Theobroma cacao]|uniref:DDE Tnp4 domain-containing protein n=1 Tax=Theobroma cacao TaxID=3641 RepID=A0A061GRC3_THECC|nr:Uncharacterized protein TCM_039339 [Theobroma cacao]